MGVRSLLAVFLIFTACSGETDKRQEPSEPAPDPQFKSETSLTGLPQGADAVGIAVSDDGVRYVLDKHSGLYELGRQSATLVFDTRDLVARYGLASQPEFTDVVALDGDRFALTAENDGFLLDLHNGTFIVYFCYFPPIDPEDVPEDVDGGAPDPGVGVSISQQLQLQGVAVKQRTESVAYSVESQLLFAQPQTFRLDINQVAGSEFFVFTAGGGEPIQLRTLDTAFIAGGMVALDGERVVLGAGSSLYDLTLTSGPNLFQTFNPPLQIAGMAEEVDGDLLLLDRGLQRIVEVPRPAL